MIADVMNNTLLEETSGHDPESRLQQFASWYGGVHGYLSLVVCFFGIPTNFINITVLTRKHMQTPINLILTWMAVSDMLTMVSYVPFAVHFYIDYPSSSISPEKNDLPWMRFLLFHVNFSATTHTISIWLGVSLAIFRYRHIQSSESGHLARARRLVRSRIVIFGITAGSVLLLIPNYLSTNIETIRNGTIFVLEDLKLGTSNVKPVVFLNLSLYSIAAKFIPCFLIVVFGGLLLRTLDMQVRIKRRNLSKLGVIIQRPLHTSRTTAMLLLVMVLFVITELPQGIVIICSLIMEHFFENVYIPLGDIMDILALVNNSINFVLYCSMNREFRRTLIQLMCSLSPDRRSSMGTELITDSVRKGSFVAERTLTTRKDLSTEDISNCDLTPGNRTNDLTMIGLTTLNEGTQTQE